MMHPANDRAVRSLKWMSLGLLAGAVTFGGLTGCSKEEEKPAPVAKKAPPPPPPVEVGPMTVAELMAEMGIDERISWDESNAPKHEDVRRAVLTFFDSFARSDQDTVAAMLPFSDGLELERMVDSGQWAEGTASIDAVEITASRDPDGEPCVLALYTTGLEYQPQLWYYRDAGDHYQFESVACPPDMMSKLEGIGEDRIAHWFELLEEEAELAIAPEEEIELDKRKMYDEQGEEESSGGSDPKPSGPMGGNRRKPSGAPKKPAPRGPGFGGLQ